MERVYTHVLAFLGAQGEAYGCVRSPEEEEKKCRGSRHGRSSHTPAPATGDEEGRRGGRKGNMGKGDTYPHVEEEERKRMVVEWSKTVVGTGRNRAGKTRRGERAGEGGEGLARALHARWGRETTPRVSS